MRKRTLGLSLLGLLATLALWTAGRPHTAPEPAASPAGAALTGAVLGAPKSAWVQQLGNPGYGVLPPSERFPGGVQVLWDRKGSAARAQQVEVVFAYEQPINTARTQTVKYQPPDARLLHTYQWGDAQTIEVFYSAALAAAFPASAFERAAPGTYIRIAGPGRATTTTRVVLSLGNNH